MAVNRLNALSAVATACYHAYSIWLFTFSDLKNIVGPSTAFALLHGFGGQLHEANSTFEMPLRGDFVMALFCAASWVWINLLPMDIDNQRSKSAIYEDAINKPWRPLPSKRITCKKAKMLMLILYPVALCISFYLGAGSQSVALLLLGVWYNDFGGANSGWLIRNFLNGCGFICFNSGATAVFCSRLNFTNRLSVL